MLCDHTRHVLMRAGHNTHVKIQVLGAGKVDVLIQAFLAERRHTQKHLNDTPRNATKAAKSGATG